MVSSLPASFDKTVDLDRHSATASSLK